MKQLARESLPRSRQIVTFLRALISTTTEVLANPTDKRLLVAFAEQLPTAAYTLLKLASEDAE